MSRDYRLRVSSPYFMYLYVQILRVWRLWAPRWLWARVPCTLCTPYCYATDVDFEELVVVTGGDSVGECDRLSQCWLLGALHMYSYTYFLVYLLTRPFAYMTACLMTTCASPLFNRHIGIQQMQSGTSIHRM